ncbi:complex I intermediate-associated protein CIA30 [Histoplasma capsulatum var. duboisii H88]|uniref:Complex I intermediate-associated protein CIA30 n=2 Tax=Ajellomyces capsulatus TaxID=5037 RepID=F0UPT3_AJEC8|nr:complex I intermediate-associated protein CIA30 [Histoplasma capsulatum var. duboisii H88]QSS53984.1 complex I intermediate-associated protein CIA30 [Histoplasma capsulatum var. duboisii H88]
MIPTAKCLAQSPGFVKRSADELARFTKMAWNLDALSVPYKPYHLLDFTDENTIAGCKTMSDRAIGGYSTANLDYIPADPATNTPAHARFHGSISTKLPQNWKVQRTGYAAFRNKDRGLWLFGRLYWDVDPYTYLALRVKSDGRRYKVNIQTDSIVDTDIHQHRLFTHHHRIPQSSSSADATSYSSEQGEDVPAALADFAPQQPSSSGAYSHTTPPTTNPDSTGWETILIRWNDFVRTNLGFAVEPQTSMVRQRIKSIGLGLTDRVQGPYDLRIHRIWATNGLSEEEMEEERRICGPNALQMTGKEWGPGRIGKPSVAEQEGEALGKLKKLKEESDEVVEEKKKREDEW